MEGSAGMDLAEFLTARLDEDAADADDLHLRYCMAYDRDGGFELKWCDCGMPARVLREVEAKRAILARCQMVLAAFHDPEGGEWPDVNRRERHHARRTIEDMASAYRDHEDYDPAWEA